MASLSDSDELNRIRIGHVFVEKLPTVPFTFRPPIVNVVLSGAELVLVMAFFVPLTNRLYALEL